jgi:GT2 family glycosyltransferase
MDARVTAIVLNWCNEPDTAECVESLLASDYEGLTVLLVDNGSPDGSGQRLHERFPDQAYLQTGENLGYTGGNNRGFDWALEARADYVLVVNNDTVIARDCVSALLSTARGLDVPVVVPLIAYHQRPEIIWYAGGRLSTTRALGLHRARNRPVGEAPRRSDISFVCGCCFLIRCDVLRELGGFDESFFAYVEDVDLSLRIARHGYRMMYEPSARLLHRVDPHVSESPFQIRQRDRNRRRLAAKHYSFLERASFVPWFYTTRLAHLSRYVASGDWPRARAIVQGALGRF